MNYLHIFKILFYIKACTAMKFVDDKEKASSFFIEFQYYSTRVKAPINLIQTLGSV
jgi:hypothetical protein